MKSREMAIIEHALNGSNGTPSRGGYRNFFAVTPGSDDDTAWKGLVEKGMAVVFHEPSELSGLRYYAVTRMGRSFYDTFRCIAR